MRHGNWNSRLETSGGIGLRSYLWGMETVSFVQYYFTEPYTLRSYLWGMETHNFSSTTKTLEWLRSYLWGMETNIFHWYSQLINITPILPMRHGNTKFSIFSNSLFENSDPTYEAWKLYMRFVTVIIFHTPILPMRHGNCPFCGHSLSCLVLRSYLWGMETSPNYGQILTLAKTPILPMRHGNRKIKKKV